MNLNYNNFIRLNNQDTKENRLKVSELMRRTQRKLLYFNLSEINVRLQQSGLANLKKSYNNHFQPKQETKQRHEWHQGKLFFVSFLSDSTSDSFGRNFRQVDGIRRYAAYTSEISMLILPLHNFFLLIKYSNYELRASEGDQSL